MIQTYFGDGKGKTTAAVGAAIRFVGCGNRVLFVQFLKNNDSSEIKVLEKVADIDLLCSNERYTLYDNTNKERTDALSCAYKKLVFDDIKNKLSSYQMIVLDEVLDALDFGYIEEDKFLQLLAEWKNDLEIVLTGHVLTEKIKDISDYISQIKNIKHPHTGGVCARKGIEY